VSFNRSHIPGAISLPAASVLSIDTLSQVVGKNEDVIFACQGKYCVDAAFASAKAVVWGYTKVSYFADGLSAWKEANYPTERSRTK
jgi:adenylate cyclase